MQENFYTITRKHTLLTGLVTGLIAFIYAIATAWGYGVIANQTFENYSLERILIISLAMSIFIAFLFRFLILHTALPPKTTIVILIISFIIVPYLWGMQIQVINKDYNIYTLCIRSAIGLVNYLLVPHLSFRPIIEIDSLDSDEYSD